MSARRYCGRVGDAVASQDGRCPECAGPWAQHRELPDDVCGTWTRCPLDGECGAVDGTWRAHGHHCTLAPGHAGPHRTAGCFGDAT